MYRWIMPSVLQLVMVIHREPIRNENFVVDTIKDFIKNLQIEITNTKEIFRMSERPYLW